MWNQLSHREKEIAMKWGREYIDEKICRNKKIEAEVDGREGILKKNDKLKLVIYPHIFEEDCYHYGEQIFDNNYFLWLCHLGELSNNTLNYDWYIKMHPAASKRDIMIIDMVREKYPRLQLLPRDTSPLQLKREGVRFALTVNGSIGHEFPLMGIQVINAGRNPHDNFDFTWNPRTKEEYDSLILHLNDLKQKIDEMGLIQYYSMEYLIYDKKRLYFDNLFFEKDYLAMLNDTLPQVGKKPGTWMYQEYMDDWTQEQHEFAYNKLGQAFQMADEWKSDILYKTTVFLELCREK